MQHARRLVELMLICCLSISAISSTAFAAFIPRVGVVSDKAGVFLTINRRKAIEFKAPNGKLSPADRAGITAKRLTALLEKGLDPDDLIFELSGKDTKLIVGEATLVVATASEAKARGITSDALAQSWIDNIRKLLALPPLTVEPTSLVVPVGENRTLKINSLLDGEITAEIADPSIVGTDVKSRPGTLVVTGTALGSTSITVRCEEYSVPVNVSVKKFAAYAPSDPLKAVVTGREAPVALVARSARDAVRTGISLESGATLRTVELASKAKGIPAGGTARVAVKVEADGPEYIPVQLTIPVDVQNERLPDVPTNWIMYSNSPERIEKFQTLFTGRMNGVQESMRLLYHHQNMMGKRCGFVIEVLNPSEQPAGLHVIEGVSDPMVDTVIVGYKAGREFMENRQDYVGRVLEFPARSRRVLVSQCLGHQETASGIIDLRQVSGSPLLVRVVTKPDELRNYEDPAGVVIPMSSLDAAVYSLSDHIYPQPLVNMDCKYTVGKPWVFLRLGKNALKHATMNKRLDGNYGVIYDIKAALDNPTSSAQTVEISFEATAGPASGVFFIDGKETLVRFLLPPSEATIQKVTLAPGQSRTIDIRTVPLSGSAYPATLIIRQTGTTAAMPN